MCVCVCEREREREREGGSESKDTHIFTGEYLSVLRSEVKSLFMNVAVMPAFIST